VSCLLSIFVEHVNQLTLFRENIKRPAISQNLRAAKINTVFHEEHRDHGERHDAKTTSTLVEDEN
jgi:hypothetical protein